MDKRLILSVAGSGKTTYIINGLSLDESALIITYTENNYHSIRERIVKKFGFLPENITIYTYFKFLYEFCYKPFLSYDLKAKGYEWDSPPAWTQKKKRDDPVYYQDSYGRLYHNRLAKLLEIEGKLELIGKRINKYFNHLYVDEVQDFGGHDFNLLMDISKELTNCILVGDFYQHTFDTSRDGNVNKNLHSDLTKYTKKIKAAGFNIDKTTLSKSYRCSEHVCEFVTSKLIIKIDSHKKETSNVFELDDKDIKNIVEDDNIIKLFYQNSSKYNCFSQNWGESKGQNHFQSICVVMNNKTYKHYVDDTLCDLVEKTRNKLYVACTRANIDLMFVSEKKLANYKK